MFLLLVWHWCRDYKRSVPCYRSPSKEQDGAKYAGRHCIMGVGRLICWAKNVGLSPLGSRKGRFINCNTITTPQAWGGAPAGNSFHSGPPAGASLLSDSLSTRAAEKGGGRRQAPPLPPHRPASCSCLMSRIPLESLTSSSLGSKECQKRQPVSKARLLHKSTLPLGEKIII